MIRTANSNELYFITLTIVEWVDVFARYEYRDLLVKNLQYCMDNKGLEIYAYVIMSNHMHMIAASAKHPLSDILRDFKTFTSKEIIKLIKTNPQENRTYMLEVFEQAAKENPLNKNFQVWQNGNHATALHSNAVIDQKVEYIHMNPVRAGFVYAPEKYLYSSAHEDSPLKITGM